MAEPDSANRVEVRGLRKRFGTEWVLRGIDFAVPPGCVFGFIGPNGAGKSTTVKILGGMLGFDAGEVRVAGLDVRVDPDGVKGRIGYVPESAALYESLKASEHLLLVGRMQGLDDETIVERSRRLFEAFDLGARFHSRIGSLSKGMRQKLMFSAALLQDPEVLFLDEPLSGLDVSSTALIKELLAELARAGKAIFYCSHIMDVVERVCDRIAIVDEGRIIASGTFDELRAASEGGGTLERVFMTLTHGGVARERVQQLLAAIGLGDPARGRGDLDPGVEGRGGPEGRRSREGTAEPRGRGENGDDHARS